MVEKTTLRRNSTQSLGDRDGQPFVVWVYPELPGRLTPLPVGRTVLGRDFASDIRLPGDETSRQHAEIVRESAMVVLRDLDSTNGVYVDGRRVSRAPLVPGSVIRIGDWLGVVVRLDGGARPGPAFTKLGPGYFGGPQTLAAVEPLQRAAATDLAVIVEGETGTGKEGVARAAHEWSGRTGPFVAVNCAALPEALAEGELFGYRKGSFTGADRSNDGYFRAAHGGTLFLDEIADLSPSVQPKLLRVLEQREVTPLGETRAVPVDVRVVVATQTPLESAVREKRFRADLLARLDGLRVRLLPLRSRVEEVPYLFTRLLGASLGGRPAPALDAAFVERLCCYDWPLNVRELANLARRLVALHGKERALKRSHLVELDERESVTKGDGAPLPTGAAAGQPSPRAAAVRAKAVRELAALTPDQLEERLRIIRALDQCAGSQTEAARVLHLTRGKLVERIKKYGIRRPRADRSV
jgi:DNA-binding NtrC family response regulator